MKLLKNKSKPILGLDISSTSVKWIELNLHGNNYRLESYGIKVLPTNAVVEKSINDANAVAETIRQAIKQSRCKAKNAAIAVPDSTVITKLIDMPAGSNEDELEALISIEADQHIPYSLDEVALDFQVQGENPTNPEQVQVLLVACRRENVELLTSVVEQANLTPKIVDVESYTIENAYSLIAAQQFEGQEPEIVAIVDIGSTITTLSILAKGNIIYTREQLFGGRQLTEEIQRRYGLSFEEADLAKKQGGLPEDYESEVLAFFKESIRQQVNRSLQFFFSSSQYNKVDHIILAGGVASLDGIANLIEGDLSIKTSIANPFANMSIASRVDATKLANDAPSLMIAVGLAMRNFD